ncbi:MAG: hypothetical protein ABSB74_09575 [Tepidisphaeraceae bacterium]
MTDKIVSFLLSRGFKRKAAEAGVEGFLKGWRATVRMLSQKESNWIIHDFWYNLNRRSMLDELIPLLSEVERSRVTEELTQLDQEFKKNTWPTLHNLNKASRATGENVWRDYRLPKNIKLDEDLHAFIDEAKELAKSESEDS